MARGSIRDYDTAKGMRYEAVADLGKDPVTGKRRQRSKSFDSKRDAQKALNAWLTDIDKGDAVDTSRKTFGEIMTDWLTSHSAQKKLLPMTVDRYTRMIHNHILSDRVAALQVQKLTANDLDVFYTRLYTQGVGDRTVELIYMRINQALNRAVRLGLVSKNVCAVLPKPKSTTKTMTVWTLEQAQTFMAVTSDKCSYGPIWILALRLGMRRGELLGLRWQDVDLERGVLRVRQTLGEINGKLIFGAPKTKAGRRDLDLRGATLAALKEHRAHQNARRLQLGAAWQGEAHDLVFTSPMGQPIFANNLQRNFDYLTGLANVPRMTIHSTRHTYATLALFARVPIKSVSYTLGHAKASITLDLYGHLLEEQRAGVADTMDALFSRQRTAVM